MVSPDNEDLRMELADLQQKCNLLTEENKELKKQVGRCNLPIQLFPHFNPRAPIVSQLMQHEPSSEEGAAE